MLLRGLRAGCAGRGAARRFASSAVDGTTGVTSSQLPAQQREPSEKDYKIAEEAFNLLNRTFAKNTAAVVRTKKKWQLIREHPDIKRHSLDTGSSEAQIAYFTGRMMYLQEHLRKKPKDQATKRGFLQLVAKRHKMLAYLQRTDPERHREVTTKLGIRIRKSLDTLPPGRKDTSGSKGRK